MVLIRNPVLSQINPFQVVSSCCFKIHFNIIFPSTPHIEGGIFPSGFLAKSLHAFLFSLTFSICLSHLVTIGLFAFQTQITMPLIREFLQSPVASPLFPDPILLTLSAHFGVTYLNLELHTSISPHMLVKKRNDFLFIPHAATTRYWSVKRKDSIVGSTKRWSNWHADKLLHSTALNRPRVPSPSKTLGNFSR